MRFLHLADLHLGKSIYGTSLLDSGDQPDWVEQFLSLAERLRPDALVIAGDVYDRSAPSGEAVQLFSHMLTALHTLGIPVMLCAGNHDSVHGPVTFWLMPYVFPALVSEALGEERFPDSDSAVRALLARQGVDFAGRNVLIAHQNVTAGGTEAERGGSETMVGGVGQIDCSAFDGFDYVALGHIHAACPVGRDSVRYAGSPLCYHFNETRQPPKGPVLVELGRKGEPVRTETLVLPPLHPMRELRGSWDALRTDALSDPKRGEYLRIVLTDCRLSPEIAAFFHELYESRDSIVMEICSEYEQFTGETGALSRDDVEQKSVEALFGDFHTDRACGVPPTEEDEALLRFAGELLRHTDPHTPPTEREIRKLLDFAAKQEARV